MSAFATVYSDIEAIHLEYHGGGSHKFYRVYVHDRVEIRQWGRVGTVGQFQLHKYTSRPEAAQAGRAQWRAKEDKGYEVAGSTRNLLSFSSAATYGDQAWMQELSAAFDKHLSSPSGSSAGAMAPASPPPPKKFAPMLCKRGDADKPSEVARAIRTLTDSGVYTFDVKWDGVRCIIEVDEHGAPTLTSRTGRDVTARFPEITAELKRLPPGPWVLDGELVCFNPDGTTSFTGANRRMTLGEKKSAMAAKAQPLTLVVFDLLAIPGGDMRAQTLYDRLTLLDTFLASVFDGSERVVRSPRTDDGLVLYDQTRNMKLEGIVAKDIGSPYVGGNRDHWIKFRHEVAVSCLITGTEEGKGSNTGSLGALKLGMLDPTGRIREVGKVGTGFSAGDRAGLWLMRDQIVGQVVEVQCAPPTPGEDLRFPVFKGIRTDVEASACSTSQLT